MKKDLSEYDESLYPDISDTSGSGYSSHSTHFDRKESGEAICEGKNSGKSGASFILLFVWFTFSILVLFKGADMTKTSFYAKTHYTCTVTGSVVRVKCNSSSDPDDNDDYYPIVEYIVDGQSFTVEGKKAAHLSTTYKVGQEMTVAYDPEFPDESIVKKDIGTYLFRGTAFIILGVFLFILGIDMIVAKRRKNNMRLR